MHATISFLLVLLPAAVLGEEKFSYDLEAEDGPLKWADLDIKNNQCGGTAQSGINIPTGPCDEVMADYVFNVSSNEWFYLCSYAFVCGVVLCCVVLVALLLNQKSFYYRYLSQEHVRPRTLHSRSTIMLSN